ncbi:type I polyketide synthase [Micromonospora humi]|uniref:type I polyketide synthase n=1 Tax=Micromonospora humi TaxID=745366 RepID=UPI003CCBA184
MYPDPDAVMGSEGAGVVVEVGPDVSDLAVGDRVFGLFHGGFAPRVVADHRVVARMPQGWSFAQAAAVPMAFLTAWYGLDDLGRLRAGERLLVHAAAGGVGMAAVQLARLWGAEVFATASPAKWAAVEALGVDPERIASSRDLGFADVFGGVDVVLDSLAGEFVDASLGMLRPGGRFVEMGKADIRDAAEVERRLGVWYKAFDLSEAGADRTAAMLADLVALFESGDLRLLPPTVADVRELPAVLGAMSRGAHVGKNVVLVPRPVDGPVLITGGTGGLGALVAAHLVEAHGVRDLVLVSRSGGPAPELDARVRVVAADVTDRAALAAVIDGIDDLAGVVHCAGVLDDGVFTSLTPERVAAVLAPKVDAVLHLHELTRDRDLALFTVFSSISAVFGTAGQAGYSAANAFLDGFVSYRRGLGLVGQSLGWGLWANAAGMGGAVAARVGGGMSDELGLALFDAAHRLPDAHVVPARLDLDAVRASGTVPPLLRRLVTSTVRRADDGGATGPDLARRLVGLADADQDRLLTDVVCTAAAGVLGHGSADAVQPTRAFKDLGFDSLTSVELRNRLNTATGLRLPATLVFDYPTPVVLAGWLRTELLGAPAPQQARIVRAATDDDAIAIVGMACRYPGGANSPDDLWRLVTDGTDAIGPFPTDRGWAADAGDYVRQGGFIDDATAFDSRLFGISPREALTMDPQQRVLLEACWEVFERAGFDPESLRGEPVGVFIGSSSSGYGTAGPLPDGAETHALTGTAPSVISGRVAYTFGIEGPAVTVDTACSSSLVALHLAAQALRSGECTMALTGGVTVLAGADIFPSFDSQGGLAGDGRCKPFSADADGTGWSEGVGVLLVEKLSDARRHGHQVLAVVRGTAVNSDGASNGLTAPNGPSQQRVITQALANARLTPADIDVVEAHGTGTALGDPIEAQALLATYGRQRPADQPLRLGSIKSNIGHTQAAAGVAGIIKMVLAMRHGELPRTLHARTPSAHIDWTSGALHLLTEPVAWPAGDRPRRAAVSSFGISGTNAHVVLEEAPTPVSAPAPAEPVAGPVPWVLSARTPAALRAQAERLREYALARPQSRPADVGAALVSTRAVLDHRAVVVGSDLASFAAALADLDTGTGGTGTGRTAFLFTGQGAQRIGMGSGLAERFPLFAETFDGIVARFDGLREALESDAIHRTVHTQAGLFAVEVALYRLFESWGVTPDYLLGHSIGEIAAAHVAGVLSLDDAVTLVAARGRLMQALPAGGAMLAVQASEAEVRKAIGRRKIDVAAVNGPNSVVVSGRAAAVDKLAARFPKTTRLTVSHAFHSSLMEPMLADFAAAIGHIEFASPRIPVVSNLTGEPVEEFTADYWVRHVREAVRFDDGMTWLADHGVTRCLEVGPAAVLSATAAPDLTYVTALRKDRDETTTVLEAAGRLWAVGVPVDWAAILPAAPRVDLPTYPFQRDRYWLMPAETTGITGAEDGAFWSAVERGDHESLAGELDGVDAGALERMLPALSAWRHRRRSQGVVEGWRYRVGWAPMPEPAPVVLSGTWLVLSETDADDIVAALASAGAEVVRSSSVTVVDGLRGVVWVGGAGWPLVAALKEIAAVGITAPVWAVTRGAVAVGRSESVTDVGASMVWGVGRVAGLELPQTWGGLVDVPARLGEPEGRRFAGVLAGGGEDQVAVRSSGVFVRRLRRAAPAGPANPVSLSGTVLVTGGTGALGSRAARWVVRRGASRVVLLSRRGEQAPGVRDLVAELSAEGAEVSVVACDVADRDAVHAVVAGIEGLTGVVHAAGVSGMESLLDVTKESFGAVVSGKVSGALHLDEATAELDLDLFLVFSSIAGVWGSGGQAAYAAGNAVLDALVESRRAAGKAGTAIAWGPWAEGGMAGEANAVDYLARRGLTAMDPDLAMHALALAVDSGDATTTVADVDWSRFVPTFAAQRPAPLFGELAVVASETPADDALAARLAGLSQTERRRELLALVRAQTAKALGYAGAVQVEPQTAFRDLGIDSVTAVEVKSRINAATGLHLGSSLVFDYPTPQALADHLLEALGFTGTDDAPAVAMPGRVDGDDIVIVGMACRYPGGVQSPEDLWRLVAGGADGMSVFPVDRGWAVPADASYSAVGGFVDSATGFDAGLFGISPREAVAMDPQQRMLLEVSWETLERSGVDPRSLRGRPVGVFVGASNSGYGTGGLFAETGDGHVLTGTANSVISGRVSYSFGFEGPAMTVDTACSSSLVALHLAAQALRSGECDLALAGGVTVITGPEVFAEFARQDGLSSDGRCKSFAGAADGTGWAEGAGMLLVERRADAERLGHRILAVISGSAVNQDGASNGLTAPNGPAQQRVIRQALASAGLTTADVDVVEAHGTGTRLGDPIEAQALLATYGQDRDEPLWLGSIKSNIGHTQAAAGVAGIIKMILAMRHGVLPATLHVDEPSPHVDWSAGAVELLTAARPWESNGSPRRAAVSAFGISGTNAHLILQEPAEQQATVEAPEADGPLPWLVSARSAEALAGQLVRLRQTVAELDPAAVAWSLATGRAALEHRAVVLAGTRDDLLTGLGAPTVSGVAAEGGLAVLFTGQGAQRIGMGLRLADRFPVFAAAFDAIRARFDQLLDMPLRDAVDSDAIHQTVYTQAGLFAVEVALFRLLQSWGITPDYLLGHSIGEIAAAHVADVLSLDDAVTLVAARGRLMQALPAGGAMLAVQASEAEVRSMLAGGVDVAAVNGPTSVVISGPAHAIDELAPRFAKATRLTVSHAFHSSLMEPMLADFAAAIRHLDFAPPRIPIVSNLTGEPVEQFTADYWVRHVREAVRFADGVAWLRAQGVTRAVEVGPSGVLSAMARLTAPDLTYAPALRKDRDEAESLLYAVAQAWTVGVPVDWTAILPAAPRVDLPTYAFQRDHYWLTPLDLPATTAADPVEAAFWQAVEGESLHDLLHTDVPASLGAALAEWRRDRMAAGAVASWCYDVTWQPVADPARPAPGSWIVLTPHDGVADPLVSTLSGAGLDIVELPVMPEDLDRAVLAEELAAMGAGLAGLAGVVSLLSLAEPADSVVPRSFLTVVQALGDSGVDARLWCVTQGAVSVGRSDPLHDATAALVWGAGRVAALEAPEQWGGLVDVPAGLGGREGDRLAGVLGGGEDQVAVRASGVFVRRLRPAPSPARPPAPRTWDGTVLVTGGTGALGAQVARWLVGRGVPRLVLTSRRGMDAPGAVELVAELSPARVDVVACDVADRPQVAELLAGIPDLRGVVHAAGVAGMGLLSQTTAEEFAAIVRGKVAGAVHLDALTHDLDLFVVFSSISGVWGSGGQPAYSAGNAFLDALVQARRAKGEPGTAIAWGPWAEAGMLVAEEGAEDYLRRRGLRPMPPALAIRALAEAVDADTGCLTVADVDWARFGPAFTASRPSPLLHDLLPADAAPAVTTPDTDRWAGHLAALGPAERSRTVLAQVRRTVAEVLGYADVDRVPPGRAFKDLGIDSLTAVELRDRLQALTGLALPASLAFDHPTATAVTDLLQSHVTGADTAAPVLTATAVTTDPIVIVSMACRYPGGVTGPEDLWRLVADGADAVGPFPTDRGWDLDALFDPDGSRAGSSYVREGGFLRDASTFDADMFGISPREALAMDPQQRLLLETTWEALERAGVDPTSLTGTPTGVFVGTNGQDYTTLSASAAGSEGYVATGTIASVMSGRLSYAFGLEGPAVTVDTACSSSLVALHLAGQALRQGECDLALVGGVTVMTTPYTFVEFSRQQGLSFDGRCKSFGAGADGTGWSEGVGMLVVERLSDARRNGHRVLAVVRGSAVNQDGASNGLTAPNGGAQQRVIRQALANSGLTTGDVDLVEAHGTGTKLGDPIEAQALLATYGQERSAERPLWLGSIKSNLGHTQAAAGVAGIIKLIMAMRHDTMPPTLYAEERTPHVDWSAGAVELLTEARPWKPNGHPRRGAVSSFGISGTNAHVIIEEPAAVTDPQLGVPPVEGRQPWLVSARSPQALAAQVERLRDFVAAEPELDPAAVAWSLATGRAALEHRAVLLGATREDFIAGLQASVASDAGGPQAAGASGVAAEGDLAFLFTGQGAQRVGMGAGLYARFPVFAEAFDGICARFDQVLDVPLREAIDSEAVHRTVYTQAGLFAVEVALFRLVESWGVIPDFLLGHSIGEIAAAHVAGVLSLDDAVTLVAARGRLMQALPAGGAMLAVRASEAEVRGQLIDGVDVAAVNGPTSVVVSGPEEKIDELAPRFARATRLTVSHAFHSSLMEPMLAEFAAAIAHISFAPPRVPVVSNLTGEPVEEFTAGYWVRHVREAVRFDDGMQWLAGNGVTRCLEVGPAGVLSALAAPDLAYVPALRKDRDETDSLLHAVATLWTAGVPVDWAAILPARARLELPTYAFQGRRFWPEAAPGAAVAVPGLTVTDHPLVGLAMPVAGADEVLLTGRLAASVQPWLADHTVWGRVVVPGTAFVDLALRAARQVGGGRIDELTVEAPLILAAGGAEVQVRVTAPDGYGVRDVRIHARPAHDADGPWTLHASGALTDAGGDDTFTLAQWPPADAQPVELDGFYDRLATDAGLDYGPVFRGLRSAWRTADTVYTEVAVPAEAHADATRFDLHPALLDAALHGCALLFPADGTARLPFAWSGVTLHATGATRLRVALSLAGPDAVTVRVADGIGEPVATVRRLMLRGASAEQLPTGAPAAVRDALFTVEWTPLPTPAGDPVEGVVVLPVRDVDQALDAVQNWLAADDAGGTLAVVTRGAVPAGGPVSDLPGAAVWGLLRSAQTENPDRIVLVDVDHDDPAAPDVVDAVGLGEPEVAVRAGEFLVPRLVRATPGTGTPAPIDGTVLITGGTGGLGALVAAHLVETHGVRDLVLVSRSGGPAPEVDARVRVVAADVTDRAALAAVIEGIDGLAGVVHCAGVLDDGVFTSLTPQRVAGVMAPKADAVVHLHELTRDLDLAMFTVFSSVSAVFGSAGQAAYAAANAFLDGFVSYRRGLGLVGQSLSWGLWANAAGMGGELAARLGGGMSDELGLALFDAARRLPDAHVVPARLDLDAVRASGTVPPLLRRLVTTTVRRADDGGATGTGLADRLAALPDADRDRLLTDVVCTAAAGVLGHSSGDAVLPGRAFKDLGFDSLTSVELRNRLNAATGLRLPATLVFDYPTPDALAGWLRTELLGAPAPAQARRVRAATDDDPIAIVGMSCRFPGGANSPEELWQLLSDGADAIGPFPTDRGWPADPAGYARQGGFLDAATDFDARLFGISPREAVAMDPQQRVLLEACWEVFERSGMDPESLRGEPVGVFIGASTFGYGMNGGMPPGSEGHLLTGTAPSIISGRVAYTFGLEGPALTVDTACSSSSVTLHLAAQALRRGECTMAIAGGVTVMASAGIFPSFDSQGGLAGDGRCKPFSADADGTGWSEGVGVLLVEKLSDARRNGHQVLAVVRGTAVNQDGASNGLTAPNGPSQQRVIGQALADARLTPADVDVVEAHGTGTVLGDPIEAQALLAAYGGDRDGQPLWLGSIKSNIGHTQCAAGVAGIIKMVLAMRHGVLPRTLHADQPSPHIDWTGNALRLLTEPVSWTAGAGRPRRAAVSSFGISGTNAHVVLEEAPTRAPAPAPTEPDPSVVPWVLSARTAEALRAQAGRLHQHLLAHPDLRPVDVGHTLASARAVLEHRAVVPAAAVETLARIAAGDDTGTPAGTGRTAVLFTGQGAQWPGMGAGLATRFPVFAEAFDAIVGRFDGLREALESDAIHQTVHTQAGLFAVEVALYRLFESWGVTPDHLLGHSIGEIAAAHVAGVFDLDDAVTLVAARGRLMQALPAGGAMLAVRASEADVRAALPAGVDVAAVNGPNAVVLSGPADAIDALEPRFPRATRLTVSHAFHSSLMEPMLAEFGAAIENLTYRAPRIPVVSNLTGEPVEEYTASYWVRHVREAVRFADGVAWLAAHGVVRCLEVGPHGVLTTMAPQTAPDLLYAPGMRRNRDEAATALDAVGRLFVSGAAVDWAAVLDGRGGRTVPLPTYAFQRERFWPASVGAGDVTSAGLTGGGHPMLAASVRLTGGDGDVYTGRLSVDTHPWLADHVVLGRIVVPGTAFVELAVHAGRGAIRELTLAAPLVVPAGGAVDLQVRAAEPDEAGDRRVVIAARADGATDWTTHATGVVSPGEGPAPAFDLTAWPPVGAEPVDVDGLYAATAANGLDYGPVFQGLRRAWRLGADVYAEVETTDPEAGRYALFPPLLDAALHGIGLGAFVGDADRPWLPFSWSGVTLHAIGATAARIRLSPAGTDTVALSVADGAGQPVATVDALALRPAALPADAAGPANAFFTVDWVPAPATPGDTAPTAVVAGDPATAERLGLPPVDEPATVADLVVVPATSVTEVLGLTQRWLADEPDRPSRLVLLTRLAVPAGGPVADPDGAAVWGLIRSAQSENPGRIVLADTDDDPASWATVVAAAAGDEPQIAVRAGTVLVPRLVRAEAPAASEPEPFPGTVLVTGGTGALGALVAEHVVRTHGVRDLVLVSRQGADAPGAADLVASLEALGARATLARGDAGDRDDLRRVIAAIPTAAPLTGVIHCAGVLDDGVLGSLTAERVERVLRPKADAARHLHELTAHLDLRWFLLFSSVAATFGAPGQANYAAANGFLDGLASHRRGLGLPAQSMAWGLWAVSSGMTGQLDDRDVARIGGGMATGDGLALFDRALAAGLPHAVLNPLDLRALAGAELPPLLRTLVPAAPRRAGESAPDGRELARRLAGLDPTGRAEEMLALVRGQAAAALGYPDPAAIEPERGLTDQGLDSLTAVELRNRLAAATGLRLPSTLVFDHPTAVRLAAELDRRLAAAGPTDPGLLDDLDRVAGGLALDGLDESVRRRAVARLLALAAKFGGTDGTAEPAATGGLDAATDDEIFAFIDNELGAS